MRRGQNGFTLIELLVVIGIIGVLSALLLPALVGARKQSKKADCKNNLKQLGAYLQIYVSTYGAGTQYPYVNAAAPVAPPGLAGGFLTPNRCFWSYLYNVPIPGNGVVPLPGSEGVFVCKVAGTQPTTTACDYLAPDVRPGNNWPAGSLGAGTPIYPGGRLSEAVRPTAPVGADSIFFRFTGVDLPAANHGGATAMVGGPGPQLLDDFNVLYFDGRVASAVPGSNDELLVAIALAGRATN